MTIFDQPLDIGYAKSPLLYLIKDPNYTLEDFQYVADVYLWQGDVGTDKPATPTYELRKGYNIQYGNTYFDIASLVTDYFIEPQVEYADPDDTKKMYVWCQVYFGYSYNNGTEIIKVPDLAISNIITVYNGYNYYMEGYNYVPQSNLGTSYTTEYEQRVYEAGGTVEAIDCVPADLLISTGEGLWLTDAPIAIEIPNYTSMHRFIINDTRSTVRRVVIDVNDGERVSILDLDLYTSELVSVPCGTTEIREFASDIDVVSYQIYGADASGNKITEAYTFIVRDVCKYGFRNLQFMNRYGVWDFLLVYGSERNTITVERSESMYTPLEVIEPTTDNPEFVYTKQHGQFHTVNIHGREELTTNTGWIDEAWNDIMKQLMLTNAIFDADSLVPFTLMDSTLRFRTSLNDGLINYTIMLKYAYTSVNTVN